MQPTGIGIGIIGGGYMGKAHAVALQAVGAVFDTPLRPVCEILCTTTEDGAAARARALGFKRSTADWRVLVDDPAVQAVVIASPQHTHRRIAEAAFARGKPVFCEKPLGATLADSRAMLAAADAAGVVHMTGFNYIRTPASQFARRLIADGSIGRVTHFRGEHTEDFLADPGAPTHWRTQGRANGAMGDLSPHILNAAMALIGPITEVFAEIETVHAERPGPDGPAPVTNDDQASLLCRFATGVRGQLFVSRVATGRKMGYAYDIYGTDGAIRFDQEDQNALWLYRRQGDAAQRGFAKILTGPAHPDYANFCLGPGHGTGYQDQIVIEARDFLHAIHTGRPAWPTFRDGLAVNQVIEAAWRAYAERRWVSVDEV